MPKDNKVDVKIPEDEEIEKPIRQGATLSKEILEKTAVGAESTPSDLDTAEKTLKSHLDALHKKRGLLQQKLEACGSKERTYCDRSPIDKADNEIREHLARLAKVAVLKLIKSIKKDDILTLIASVGNYGNLRQYRLFDIAIMRARGVSGTEFVEVRIEEVKADGKVIAKSTHNNKLLLMGAVVDGTDNYNNECTDILFLPLK